MMTNNTIYEYRVSLDKPINQDSVYISLRRYTMRDDIAVAAEILTVDGWQSFEPWEMIPVGNLPSITGRDMMRQAAIERLLAEFQERLVERLNTEFANPPAPPNPEASDG